VENHRRGDSSISIFDSIRHQFNGSATEPVLLSRLSMLQMHENELETAVNMEREAAAGDDLSRMEAYDDLETLPSVTSRSRARNLMSENSEYGDDEDKVENTTFYRPYVRMFFQDPRVIQSTPSAQAAAWPTSEEELSFNTILGSASPDHQSVGITRNDDFEEDKDVSMSSSRGDPSQTSKSIFSLSSWFAGNASQSNSSHSTDSRDNASMSLGGLSGF